MAHVIGYRLADTTVTTGTGTYTLDRNPPNDFFAFEDQLDSTDTTIYFCENFNGQGAGDLEVGKGTFTQGPPDTLTRDTILYSTNNGSAVNWGTGTKNIVSSFSSGIMDGANNLSEIASASTARTNLGLGDVAIENLATLPDITVVGGDIAINPNSAVASYLDMGRKATTAEDAYIRFFTNGDAVVQSRIHALGGTGTDLGTIRVKCALLQLAQQASEVVRLAEGSGASVEVHGEMNCDVGSGRLVLPVGADLWAT